MKYTRNRKTIKRKKTLKKKRKRGGSGKKSFQDLLATYSKSSKSPSLLSSQSPSPSPIKKII